MINNNSQILCVMRSFFFSDSKNLSFSYINSYMRKCKKVKRRLWNHRIPTAWILTMNIALFQSPGNRWGCPTAACQTALHPSAWCCGPTTNYSQFAVPTELWAVRGTDWWNNSAIRRYVQYIRNSKGRACFISTRTCEKLNKICCGSSFTSSSNSHIKHPTTLPLK